MTIKIIVIKEVLKRCLSEWLLDKPFALQVGEWEDWHSNTKAEHPVKYLLQETIPGGITSWMHINITWPIRDKYWAMMHRHSPKHQYNTIRPRTLEPGYHDCDVRILHAVMEEVTVFFETGCNYPEWKNSSPEHLHAYNELEVVYTWWKEQWPHRDTIDIWGEKIPETPSMPKEWGFMAPLNEKYRDTPIVKEWSRIAHLHMRCEQDWDEKENEMLRRVMYIRKYMWH